MKIPVFHDDQHGTAIIVSAAVVNGLQLVGKELDQIKVAVSGAGAAALACLDLLVALGLQREKVFVADIQGVVYKGRKEEMDGEKIRYAQDTQARTLADIIPGADLFLGLSAGGVLQPDMLKAMAHDPLILALANPEPEIRPEAALAVRPCDLCTGRSDYPNQVNNVLCFPFIFRGRLGCRRHQHQRGHEDCRGQGDRRAGTGRGVRYRRQRLRGQSLSFGRDYLIPRPFDPRLIERIAPAVARAAMDSGVATRPLASLESYRQQLARFVYHSGNSMKPVFEAAKLAPKRVIDAEGEEERVLRAVQVVVDEGLAVLVGRAEVIAKRIKALGLRLKSARNCEVVNILSDPRYQQVVGVDQLARRRGITEAIAKEAMRSRASLIAAMLLNRGDVNAMLCGRARHLR